MGKYKYTNEQRKIMMEESKNYYKRLKDSGLFKEGVPPMAHSYSWAFLAILSGKKPKCTLDIKVEDFLDGITWSTL